jgi:hypothetical protein
MLALAACSREPETNVAQTRTSAAIAPAAPANSAQQSAKLAYSHQLALEMPAASLRARFERARDRCLEDAALGCVVLHASINMGSRDDGMLPFAQLTVRLPHSAVATFEDSLIAALPGEQAGEALIRSRSTSAEDLSQAIADADRRLAQLTDYRERLTALAARQDVRAEDLIKIEGELSSVQGQIETLTAQKRGLDRRVDTESLSIGFQSIVTLGNAGAPIARVWNQGAALLGDSAADALRFAILSIPWLPLVALAVFLATRIRWFLRRRPTAPTPAAVNVITS